MNSKNNKQRLFEVMQRLDTNFNSSMTESGGRNSFLREKIPVDEIRSRLANQKYNDELMIDYNDIQNSLPSDFVLDDWSANIFVYAFDDNGNVSDVITLFETNSIKLSQPFDIITFSLNKGDWGILQLIMDYLKMDTSFFGATEQPREPDIEPNMKAKFHTWVEEFIDQDTGERVNVRSGEATFASGEKSNVYWDKQGKMNKVGQMNEDKERFVFGRGSKKRLFEVMQRVAPNFKGKALNEELEGVKYRAEVTGIGENVWSTNAMEYNTEEEAKQWLDGLSGRWFGYDMGRVVPTSTPTGQPVDLQNDIIYQNFRRK